MRTFFDYQTAQMRTAKPHGLLYVAVALAGEVGEACNEVKKLQRDDKGALTNERRDKIVDELGDVLWYLTQFARELGVSLAQVAERNVRKLEARYDLEPTADNIAESST